jgi:hypothetical protein
MQVRCYRCGTSFEFGRPAMEAAVASAGTSHAKIFVVECVKCRQAIKVPMAQIRRLLPQHAPAQDAPAGAPPAETHEEPPADKA